RDTISNELSDSEEITDYISENLLSLKKSKRNTRTVLKNQDYQEDQESSLKFILQQLQHLEKELINICRSRNENANIYESKSDELSARRQ
ncbi:10295_t:CDS:1, partial [Scutellospora calospora]